MTTAVQQQVDDWNRRNATGRVVRVRRDNGDILTTVTRTSAFLNAAGIPVIFVKGIAGYYLLDRVTLWPGLEDEDGLEYTRAGGHAICEVCAKRLCDHPEDLDHQDRDGIPFLNRLCDGSLVKL